MMDATVTVEQVLDQSELLSPPEQLRLIGLLVQRLRSQLQDTDEPIDILSTLGVGAEVWQEIDTDAYIEQERQSWDN
jgi:hypothetical protein